MFINNKTFYNTDETVGKITTDTQSYNRYISFWETKRVGRKASCIYVYE